MDGSSAGEGDQLDREYGNPDYSGVPGGLGPGLPAVQLFQCGDCGPSRWSSAGAGGAHIGGLIPVVRPLLTSEPTGNVIPRHAGSSSGLGSARPGLSQKGGLPILARAFVGSRPPTRAPSP